MGFDGFSDSSIQATGFQVSKQTQGRMFTFSTEGVCRLVNFTRPMFKLKVKFGQTFLPSSLLGRQLRLGEEMTDRAVVCLDYELGI